MYSVLSVFRLSLFCRNHSAILSTSLLRSLQSLSMSSAEPVSLVSSAYTFEVHLLIKAQPKVIDIQDEEERPHARVLRFESDLKIEVILAIFQMSGKIPISNEELNMAARGLQKIPAASFTNNFTETLSYPADLEHFNFLIPFSICFWGTIYSERC